jgi:hypothetical protein
MRSYNHSIMIGHTYQPPKEKKDFYLYPVPENITPEQKEKILDRLNSLNTEEEILNMVRMYAGQGVVGRKIARSILNWKREFGTFKDLQQLAATPRVGSSRFAIILLSLCNYQ